MFLQPARKRCRRSCRRERPSEQAIRMKHPQNRSPGRNELYRPEAVGMRARALTARGRPHCQFVFLRSKVCSPLPSAWPRGLRPTTSTLRFPTVTSIGPGRIVSSCENQPMLGTLAHAFLRAVPAFVPVCLLRKRLDQSEFSWRYYESARS